MTAAVVPDAAWMALLQRAAVRVEDERLDVGDLVLLGILTGVWPRFTEDVRRGLALERDAAAPIAAADVRAAATAFRYARGLVSAAEFTTWLRERELTLPQLSAALARQLREQRTAEGGRADDAALASVLRVDALCRNTLDELAAAAIDRLAAAHRLGQRAPVAEPTPRVESALAQAQDEHAAGLPLHGEAELRRRLEHLVALDGALSQLREEVAETEALEQCLASHRLDWLRLSGEELALTELGAAREARLLVREDGLTLTDVALRAGVPVHPRTVYLDDVPTDASAAFAAAAPGEVVGPWHQDERWRVLVLMEKKGPTLDDATLTQRATDELLAAVLQRHRAGRSERLCVL